MGMLCLEANQKTDLQTSHSLDLTVIHEVGKFNKVLY